MRKTILSTFPIKNLYVLDIYLYQLHLLFYIIVFLCTNMIVYCIPKAKIHNFAKNGFPRGNMVTCLNSLVQVEML